MVRRALEAEEPRPRAPPARLAHPPPARRRESAARARTRAAAGRGRPRPPLRPRSAAQGVVEVLCTLPRAGVPAPYPFLGCGRMYLLFVGPFPPTCHNVSGIWRGVRSPPTHRPTDQPSVCVFEQTPCSDPPPSALPAPPLRRPMRATRPACATTGVATPGGTPPLWVRCARRRATPFPLVPMSQRPASSSPRAPEESASLRRLSRAAGPWHAAAGPLGPRRRRRSL